MTIELWALTGVTTVLFLSIILQQIIIDKVYGTKYALSNRGTLAQEPSPTVERLTKLVRNHVEGLTVFGFLVLVGSAAGASNAVTQYAAVGILAARVLHFLFFALGVTPLRSIVWGLGFLIGIPAFAYGLVREVGLPF